MSTVNRIPGPTGPRGPKGERGLTGPQGPLGPAGPRGVVGPSGATGGRGAQGPVGPAGAVGSKGNKGDTGDKGDDADFAGVVDVIDPTVGDVGRVLVLVDDDPITFEWQDFPTPSVTESDVVGLVADLAAKAPTSRVITAGTGLSGGGDLSADRTIALANTAVTPGSYTSADITVDAQGRITAAANGSGGVADEVWESQDPAIKGSIVGPATSAGDFSTGNKFYLTRAGTVTGGSFYWPGGLGSKTIDVKLWDNSGTQQKTVAVAVNAAGIYTGTFASSYSATAKTFYWITLHDQAGGFFVAAMSSGIVLPPFALGAHSVIVATAYAAGNAMPSTVVGASLYPIGPTLTVP